MTSSFRDLRQGWTGRSRLRRFLPSFPNHPLALKNPSRWTVSHPQGIAPPRRSPESSRDWPRGRWFPFSLYFQLFPGGKASLVPFAALITGSTLSGDVARLVGWLRAVSAQGRGHREWMPARPPWPRQADYTCGSLLRGRLGWWGIGGWCSIRPNLRPK